MGQPIININEVEIEKNLRTVVETTIKAPLIIKVFAPKTIIYEMFSSMHEAR
jgi:hypothetical protein